VGDVSQPPRVATVIDSYTPKTLEQFLETEDEQESGCEDYVPEELCTPDMMTSHALSSKRRSVRQQTRVEQASPCPRLVLHVNNQVPSILDSEDMMLPV
jgi:hypothetical protein